MPYIQENNSKLAPLALKYLAEELNLAEQAELNELLMSSERNQQLFNRLTDLPWLQQGLTQLYRINEKEEAAWSKLSASLQLPVERPVVSNSFSWLRIAAMLCLPILVAIAYLIIKPASLFTGGSGSMLAIVFKPAGNEATLTANGKTYPLQNSAAGQTLFQQSIVNVINQDTTLWYQPQSSTLYTYNGPSTIHTISTPRGGKYLLRLEDGSQVWINPQTAVSFPVPFTGNERWVRVNGEAYFEVAHNVSRPFVVYVADSAGNNRAGIKVLGTRFNVNGYASNAIIKTTLLEGRLQISQGKRKQTISKGELAIITSTGTITVSNSSQKISDSSSWQGQFIFEEEEVGSIITQVGRWYNFEVEIRPGVKGRPVSASFPRNTPFHEVLEIMKHFNIKTTINGNKVIVEADE